MAEMYVCMVIRGLKKKDLSDIPTRYRAKVQEILEKLES